AEFVGLGQAGIAEGGQAGRPDLIVAPGDVAVGQHAHVEAARRNQSERFVETLWDTGGTDTIDCANQTLACEIDLTAGSWSSIGVRAVTIIATSNRRPASRSSVCCLI
ncbi:MAG: hypothetical protein HGB05_03870, partial [Chloroflexi bacterium]|nr:hypothetical protein [Chloroflexota bacterium]